MITEVGFEDKIINSKIALDENFNQVRANIVAKKIENFARSFRKIILVYPVPNPGLDVPNTPLNAECLETKILY